MQTFHALGYVCIRYPQIDQLFNGKLPLQKQTIEFTPFARIYIYSSGRYFKLGCSAAAYVGFECHAEMDQN